MAPSLWERAWGAGQAFSNKLNCPIVTCYQGYQADPVRATPLQVPVSNRRYCDTVQTGDTRRDCHTFSLSFYISSFSASLSAPSHTDRICFCPEMTVLFYEAFVALSKNQKPSAEEQHQRSAQVSDINGGIIAGSSLFWTVRGTVASTTSLGDSIEAPQNADPPLVWVRFWSTWWMTCADAQALSDWGRLKTPNSLTVALLPIP